MQIIPDVSASAVVALLQGKKVLFMTNNSMKSRQSYLDKCLQVGLPAHVVRQQAND
jgi:ribonucleotide monophosphatase NagD (HAD superfamily)